MPYILTTNPPGSTSSWFKIETDSVLSGHSGEQIKKEEKHRIISLKGSKFFFSDLKAWIFLSIRIRRF